jgi:hypothetical protein
VGARHAAYKWAVIDDAGTLRAARFRFTRRITSVLSLGLIGDVSGQRPEYEVENPIRDIFDKQARRKPLAFAADAVSYGI